MSASGTQVDVNDAYATRLLSRGRFECGRVESNHHSHWRRGYSALSSPCSASAGETRRPVGFEPTLRGSRPRMLAVTSRPPREWKAGSVPRNRGQRRYRPMAPEPAVLPFGSPACAIAALPPPHRLALEACRPSCTLGPALCTALFRHFPTHPSASRSFVDSAGGIRTHGLELMRLARTAAPLPRAALSRESEDLVGRIRTCDLRRPKSVGWPSPLRPVTSELPGRARTCARGVEAPCSSAELRGDRRPWNRTTLDRHIRAAPAQPARRRRISSGGFEPPSPTIAGWCSIR